MKIKTIDKISQWFQNNFLSGHVNIGKITVWGRNAMKWGVRISTKRYGYICFRLPLPCFGKWYPLYFYCSPNGTSWAATFMLGKAHSPDDWVKSRIRYKFFGHNFEVHGWNNEYNMENYAILRAINNMVATRMYPYVTYAQEHYNMNGRNKNE